jgi:hypothetical protein
VIILECMQAGLNLTFNYFRSAIDSNPVLQHLVGPYSQRFPFFATRTLDRMPQRFKSSIRSRTEPSDRLVEVFDACEVSFVALLIFPSLELRGPGRAVAGKPAASTALPLRPAPAKTSRRTPLQRAARGSCSYFVLLLSDWGRA